MREFAKLYQHDDYGQILVKIDSNEDSGNPEVRFFAMPPELGVSSIAMGYEDTDSGWDKAEEVFNKVDEEFAVELIGAMFEEMKNLGGSIKA